MKDDPIFIDIEGPDCSGKSAVSRLFAKETGWILRKTPHEELRGERHEVDAQATPKDHYMFYLDGIFKSSKDFAEILASGEKIICDRYWLTTYVYHLVMGVKVDINDFKGITTPDLTILLLVDKEVQAKRMLERGMSAGDRRMLNHQLEISQTYQEVLKKTGIPQLTINTSYLSQKEVVEKIKKTIQ